VTAEGTDAGARLGRFRQALLATLDALDGEP